MSRYFAFESIVSTLLLSGSPIQVLPFTFLPLPYAITLLTRKTSTVIHIALAKSPEDDHATTTRAK
ncbi:MAG: hypothetical protein ACXW6J_26205, partial [Candidatus Binatia bacterium]